MSELNWVVGTPSLYQRVEWLIYFEKMTQGGYVKTLIIIESVWCVSGGSYSFYKESSKLLGKNVHYLLIWFLLSLLKCPGVVCIVKFYSKNVKNVFEIRLFSDSFACAKKILGNFVPYSGVQDYFIGFEFASLLRMMKLMVYWIFR